MPGTAIVRSRGWRAAGPALVEGSLLGSWRGGVVKAEEIPCAFCSGRGHDPFGIPSEFSTCCVCGGRGHVWVAAPHLVCAHCQGSGAVKTFTCTVCGGKGAVPAWPEATEPCPECGGSGDDRSAGSLDCLACRGTGRVPAAPPPHRQGFEAARPQRHKSIQKSRRNHPR